MPIGRFAGDLAHRRVQVAAEGQDVAAVAHRDGQPDGLLAVDAEHGLRRIRVAAADGGDVAQADHAPVRDEVDVQDVLFGVEAARDAQRELLVAGLDDARRQDHVLGPERVHEGRLVEPEAGELLGRELDEDGLVLRPQHLDLENVRHAQQPRADVLGVVAQLAMREAVGGEAVDDPERVAELVVEERSHHAGRQGVAHVGDALAHVVPGVVDLPGRRRAFQVDEDRRDAGLGEAAQEIEVAGSPPGCVRAAR